MQHATSNCERENNYERTKNSLEDEEDSYSGHRKHVPSRFLRLISMHARPHRHTHTPIPHTCMMMCMQIYQSLCVFRAHRTALLPSLLDKCKYERFACCALRTENIYLMQQLCCKRSCCSTKGMQRRNEETTAQQAACRVWHAEGDEQVEEEEE